MAYKSFFFFPPRDASKLLHPHRGWWVLYFFFLDLSFPAQNYPFPHEKWLCCLFIAMLSVVIMLKYQKIMHIMTGNLWIRLKREVNTELNYFFICILRLFNEDTQSYVKS